MPWHKQNESKDGLLGQLSGVVEMSGFELQCVVWCFDSAVRKASDRRWCNQSCQDQLQYQKENHWWPTSCRAEAMPPSFFFFISSHLAGYGTF